MQKSELVDRVRAWITADPDPVTQHELRALSEQDNPAAITELEERFSGELEFGTAGLRGVMGGGPHRMNRAVVLRATWGLGTHLLQSQNVRPLEVPKVVIGFDGRHMSATFAQDAACVLAKMGFRVYLFSELGPTPLLAYAVKKLAADAGIMVTASHNPPEYNGYKVYWGNGAQIISPIDEHIARAISQAPPAREIPKFSSIDEGIAQGTIIFLGDEMASSYLASIDQLRIRRDGDRSLRIVYTPLHGVGHHLAAQALSHAGFTQVFTVPEQRCPDPNFSTVAFPNPEEKGAMDLAFALAKQHQADLVVANDPDADRLAVAMPHQGGYLQLTGNQVGVLLGHYVLSKGLTQNHVESPAPLVIASIVSSPMLGAIARQMGATYEEVLTGFKWIANLALAKKTSNGISFAFGYEEALGYTVGELVRDKDGISALLLFAELASVLKAQHITISAHLEQLYRTFGLFMSTQVNITRKGIDGPRELQRMMQTLRDSPPTQIGGDTVTSVRDHLRRHERRADGSVHTLDLPPSDVLVFELGSGNRVIARPSGTEPKAKFYIDVQTQVAPDEALSSAEARAGAVLEALAHAFVQFATATS